MACRRIDLEEPAMDNIWSCLPVSLFPQILSGEMTTGQWAAAAKEIGFDRIDISTLFLRARTPMELGKIKRELDEAGMKLAMITTYPDFTTPDPRQRERELAYAIADIASASELGAQYLRITAGQDYEDQDEDESVCRAADAFARCCEYAERWGVQLLLENHSKPGAWKRMDFDFDTNRFLKLVNATQDLPVGINFDTANTYASGDDAIDVFCRVSNRVQTIHINDVQAPYSLSFTGIGKGTAPIGGILKEAKKRGFAGLLSIEEVGGRGLEGIYASYQNAKKLWETA